MGHPTFESGPKVSRRKIETGLNRPKRQFRQFRSKFLFWNLRYYVEVHLQCFVRVILLSIVSPKVSRQKFEQGSNRPDKLFRLFWPNLVFGKRLYYVEEHLACSLTGLPASDSCSEGFALKRGARPESA